MQNRNVEISEQTSQKNYSITKLDSAKLGITISEEETGLILI